MGSRGLQSPEVSRILYCNVNGAGEQQMEKKNLKLAKINITRESISQVCIFVTIDHSVGELPGGGFLVQ